MPTSPTLQGLNCDTGEALGMDKGVLEGEAHSPQAWILPRRQASRRGPGCRAAPEALLGSALGGRATCPLIRLQ